MDGTTPDEKPWSERDSTLIMLDLAMYQRAQALADARLHDASRQHSVHRPTPRTPQAQLRGALGEVAVEKWAHDHGWRTVAGFDRDAAGPDLLIGGVGFEVMTAQVKHRKFTGFCVTPNKLWAARKRRAEGWDVWGYLFVGTDATLRPGHVHLQAGCPPRRRRSRRPPRHLGRREPRHPVGHPLGAPEDRRAARRTQRGDDMAVTPPPVTVPDPTAFSRLVAEGQALRRAFDAATRPMQILTAADLRRRSR